MLKNDFNNIFLIMAFLVLLLLAFLQGTECGNDFFIAIKHEMDKYKCVTNSNFALSWIPDDIDKSPEAVSTSIPKLNNIFDNKISKNDETRMHYEKNVWDIRETLNSVILDRRWEEMDTFETNSSKQFKTLEINKANFDIAISLRGTIEFDILLCNTDTNPRCYWFMVSTKNGCKIRKCNMENFKQQQFNTYDSLTRSEHECNASIILNNNWSHFKIRKDVHKLSLIHMIQNEASLLTAKPILEATDKQEYVDVKNILFHSQNLQAPVFWKIHKMEYIRTLEKTTSTDLGPHISPTKNSVCISMFLSMCNMCSLNVTLKRVSDNLTVAKNTYYTANTEWKGITFRANSLSNGTRYQLSVSTIAQDDITDSYWAIDSVRQCQDKEYRMISSDTTGKCQLMFGEDNTISSSNPTNEYNLTNNCTEDTVGEFCVPCKWIYNDCQKIKICSKKGCSCSAGFKMSEKNNSCNQTCDSGFYGQNCQKECQNCHENDCNHINGSCKLSCSRNYRGETCEIPPATVFKKPPTITNITYTEATISVDQDVYIFQTNDTPSSFAVYYKKTEEKYWTLFGDKYKFSEVNSVTVSKLEPDTTYLVKCVITTEENEIYNNDNYIPIANFTTDCQNLSQNDFYIKPSTSSVYIFFNKKIHFMCKYNVSISNNTNSMQRTIQKTNDTLIENLTPFSRYNITIESRNWKMEESFSTSGIMPEKVRNLTIIDISSTSVRIYWERPITLYDFDVKGYNVEYQRISSYMCNRSDSSENMAAPQTSRETTLFANISNLTPYSRYKFSVYAITSTKINGRKNTLDHTTSASNSIEPSEIPEIRNVTAKANTAEVELSEIDCDKIRGPIILNMTLICTNEWCQNKTKMFENGTVSVLSLEDLTAFTNYTLEAKFCRNENCTKIHERSFQTQPTVCNPVNDSIVYSKDKNSISIRWKAPYPPTGILKDYGIRHYPSRDDSNAKLQKNLVLVQKNMSCTLWPDYNCIKLTNLEENTPYTISIFARNENPSNYSYPAKINGVTTCTEASDRPYDLKYNWTMNNDLELKWKHPNQSNGEIHYFAIKIMTTQDKTQQIKLYVNENNYTLIYRLKINATSFPLATTYVITIYAYNDLFGKELNESIVRPPDLPVFLEKPQFHVTNTTISINISIREPQKEWDDYRLIVSVANPDYNDLNSNHQNVVANCSIKDFNITYTIDIGESNKTNFVCTQTTNYILNPGTHYNISILLINTFKNMTRQNLTTYLRQTTGEKVETVKWNPLPLLSLLLLIIPIAAILFLKRNQLMAFLRNKGSETTQEDEILLTGLQNNFKGKESKPEEKVNSKPIKIIDFDKYVKESIETGELERQHSLFPHGQTKPWTCGSMVENKTKNRYNNLIAYDHSRVILEKINGDPHSDYINANYIDGHQVQKAYIATQGPKASTLNEFWRMIWQENVQYIVMLANVYEGGKKNVEKYWPSPNAKLQFDNITVTHISSEMHENYEHRTFNINSHNVTRKLEQLHFLAWPDHGVPLYCQSLVPLLEKMLKLPLNSKSPIVVHCSAGVGRTGTVLLSHINIKMAESEGYVDVLKNLQNLREQRANLVDNAEQYKLAHLVVLECLFSMKTAIPCGEIDKSVRKILENGGVKEQMKQLKDTQWRDEVMKAIGQKGKNVVIVKEKNRFQDIIPEIQGRIALNCFSEQESYINAVTVDAFRRPGRYIVTQQPLPTTLSDFWRLVEENDVTTIISLNEIDPDDVTSCSFWPSSANPQVEPADNITLSHVNTLSLACYDLVTVELNGNMNVEILAMKNWPSGTNCPRSTAQFLTFWEDSDAASKKSEKVIVTCYDGAKACGLYVAMSFIIEKIKLEQVCDVYQAVRTVRHNRCQFVEEDQFEFLYRASVDYVNGFQSYADFI